MSLLAFFYYYLVRTLNLVHIALVHLLAASSKHQAHGVCKQLARPLRPAGGLLSFCCCHGWPRWWRGLGPTAHKFTLPMLGASCQQVAPQSRRPLAGLTATQMGWSYLLQVMSQTASSYEFVLKNCCWEYSTCNSWDACAHFVRSDVGLLLWLRAVLYFPWACILNWYRSLVHLFLRDLAPSVIPHYSD